MRCRYLILPGLLASQLAWAAADVNFSGTLVQEPCTLAPEDAEISVDFGSVIVPYLYANTRSPRMPFRIRLLDCDTSLGNLASVQFTGTEAPDQPGLLAPAAGSTAQGVAIGIETLRGDLIPLNSPSGQFPLEEGDTTLFMAAFVQASSSALLNRSIVPGSLAGVATFEITYE